MTTPTISAYTATLPGREGIAVKAIQSILPQVDRVQVVLNNFNNIKIEGNEKVTIVLHNNALEDGSRFIDIEYAPPGYTLVFDDDIIYPPDYVATLITKIKMYRVPCMVTPMGKLLKHRPLTSYYRDVYSSYKTFSNVGGDHVVHVPGACGIMWDNRKVFVRQDHMLIPNSDICLGKFCKDNNVKPIVIAHRADWLTSIWPEAEKGAISIYGKYKNNDKKLTDFVNKWI